jgi:hypothetical protein
MGSAPHDRIRVASLIALVLLLLAVSAGAETLRYDWPDSGSVSVEIQRLSIERRVAMRWTLRWRPTGDRILFELAEPELIAIRAGGQDLAPSSPLGHSVSAVESMLPNWEVDREGRYLGLAPLALSKALDTSRQRYLTAFKAKAEEDEGYRRATLETLASAALQLQAQRRVQEFWRVWVGEWVGIPADPQWVSTDSIQTQYLDEALTGERLRQVESLPIERGFELAHLRSTFEVERGSQVRRSEIIEARLHRTTLRPLGATLRVSVTDQAHDAEQSEAYEEQLFVFHWPDLPKL